MRFLVYAPPLNGLPYLAVVLSDRAELIACETVSSVEAGKMLLKSAQDAMPEFVEEAATQGMLSTRPTKH